MKTATARQATRSDEPLPILVDRRLKNLPRAAIEKFERLRNAESRARSMRDALGLEQARVMEARAEVLRELGHYDRKNPNPTKIIVNEETGGRREVPDEPPERAALVARLERLKRELDELGVGQREASFGLNVDDILYWLGERADLKFVAVPQPKFAFSRTSSLDELLEENRAECAAIRDQIEAAAAAPMTTAEAKARMRAEVEAIAARGRPEVANLLAGAGVQWPTQQVVTSGEYQSAATIDDGFAVAVWATKDAMIAALDKEIDRTGDDATALSAEDRAGRISGLQAKLIELQRIGEAIAVTIERHGRVARRHCLDPMILLGIAEA